MKKILNWSNVALLVIIFSFVYEIQDLKFYKDPHKIINSDASNYYAYLPLKFIFHQLDYKFDEKSFPIIKDYLYGIAADNGKIINPYTMGMAIAYSPFFFIVHYPLKWLGYEATGFTEPYRWAIMIGCIFYVFIALLLLKKILLKYFNDSVTAITMIGLVLATNLFYYVTFEPGMTHAYNFAFGIYFLYLTIKWHEKPKVWNSLGIGLVTGLISLIRPTDIVIALVFIFWNVKSWESLRNNIRLFISKWYLILIILTGAILVWCPQLIYWKIHTDHYFYNPYKDAGFRFFFTQPFIWTSLFSYRKGWLLYTPFMLLILPGFIYLFKKHKELFWPAVSFFVINLWIISSWCLPWYGGSYGQRAYVASYAILSLPIAAFFSVLFQRSKVLNLIAGVLITGIFVLHNLFQTEQYHLGAIHYVSMTREAYWDSFLHKHPSPRFKYLLSYPDYESAKLGKYSNPVVDPRYTGKLNKNEISLLVRQDIINELKTHPEKLAEFTQKANKKNLSLYKVISEEAEIRMNDEISQGIIIPKH